MQILLAKQFFLCFYFSMLNCGDFYFYSFHAAILNFAKSVERNPKENGAAKLQITFLFSNNSATIFFKFLGGGKLLFINTLYILIHPQPHNLLISAHVVNQIGQGVPGGIPRKADDAVLHLVFAHHAFHLFPDICAVGMQLLPSVVIVYQQLDRDGVVLLRTRGHRLLYQLALGVDLRVVLVAVISLTALLRPTGVRVPVPLLVGLFLFILLGVSFLLVPELAAAPFLYGPVLLAGVALARHLHETAVNDDALVHYQVPLPQESVEVAKESVVERFPCQLMLSLCLL